MTQTHQPVEHPNETKEISPQPTPQAQNQDDQREATEKSPQPVDHTRYGDWEKNGRCIDF